MSEESQQSEGAANSKNEGSQSVDVNEVLERIKQLEQTNKRLLDESKSHKQKLSEQKAERERLEEESIKNSGDLAKMLEHEKKLREEAAKEAARLKGLTLDQRIRESVSRHAKDVHDIDDLLNQPKHRSILLAGIDKENLSVDEEAVKNFVNRVLEDKPWLKKHMEQPGVDTKKPNGSGAKSVQDYSKMSSSEILADIKKSKKL